MERITIIFLFIVLLISFTTRLIVFKKNKINAKGMPSINKVLFKIGKMTMFASWMLLMMHINVRDISIVSNTILVQRGAIILFASGVILNIISSINLGFSFRMGLPGEITILKTEGLYRFSRNPMILSLFLISIASCLYTLSPIVWALTLITICIHHKIVIVEESFLQERFSEQWVNYSNSVRRYI